MDHTLVLDFERSPAILLKYQNSVLYKNEMWIHSLFSKNLNHNG